MAMFDVVGPSEWNEGMFSLEGCFSKLLLYLMRSFDD